MPERTYTAIIDRCPNTGLYVGHVPSLAGAHSQGKDLDEFRRNLAEVISILVEEGESALEADFIGTQTFVVNRHRM